MRKTLFGSSAIIISAFIFSACPQDPVQTTDSGDVLVDAGSQDALVGDAGEDPYDAHVTDSAAPCVDGEVDCPCDNDTCEDLLQCVVGVCRDCEPGLLDCRCFSSGNCLNGGICDGENRCIDCIPGSENCRCDDAQNCEDGLSCFDGLACITSGCTPGRLFMR